MVCGVFAQFPARAAGECECSGVVGCLCGGDFVGGGGGGGGVGVVGGWLGEGGGEEGDGDGGEGGEEGGEGVVKGVGRGGMAGALRGRVTSRVYYGVLCWNICYALWSALGFIGKRRGMNKLQSTMWLLTLRTVGFGTLTNVRKVPYS